MKKVQFWLASLGSLPSSITPITGYPWVRARTYWLNLLLRVTSRAPTCLTFSRQIPPSLPNERGTCESLSPTLKKSEYSLFSAQVLVVQQVPGDHIQNSDSLVQDSISPWQTVFPTKWSLFMVWFRCRYSPTYFLGLSWTAHILAASASTYPEIYGHFLA